MPRRDGTGPLGQGSMTGRSLGNCNNANSFNRGVAGMGFGRRIGRGLRNFFGANSNFNHEAELKSYIAQLEIELNNAKDQLKNIPNKETTNG